jgi:hypothetical protein
MRGAPEAERILSEQALCADSRGGILKEIAACEVVNPTLFHQLRRQTGLQIRSWRTAINLFARSLRTALLRVEPRADFDHLAARSGGVRDRCILATRCFRSSIAIVTANFNRLGCLPADEVAGPRGRWCYILLPDRSSSIHLLSGRGAAPWLPWRIAV